MSTPSVSPFGEAQSLKCPQQKYRPGRMPSGGVGEFGRVLGVTAQIVQRTVADRVTSVR
jgi:hypothetical protein